MQRVEEHFKMFRRRASPHAHLPKLQHQPQYNKDLLVDAMTDEVESRMKGITPQLISNKGATPSLVPSISES